MDNIRTGLGFNDMCKHLRYIYAVKGIIIYLSHTFLIAGSPYDRNAAVNDNQAKS